MMAHERDLRKLRYCFERRIPLVCIPFGMSETLERDYILAQIDILQRYHTQQLPMGLEDERLRVRVVKCFENQSVVVGAGAGAGAGDNRVSLMATRNDVTTELAELVARKEAVQTLTNSIRNSWNM